MKKAMDEGAEELSARARIDARIAELGDWRGATLARVRALILAADPEIVEEWKWRGTPVWSHGGSQSVYAIDARVIGAVARWWCEGRGSGR